MQEHLSKPDEESALLSLPFDHYERYAITRAIVEVVRGQLKRPQLNVLDVGGAPGSLSRFLPADRVYVADLEMAPCDGYLRADGAALPFRDGVFDIVTCHDTLEHVPRDRREPFLIELVRVAGDFLIVNGPFYDPGVESAERLVLQNITDTVGEDHPHFCFLQQHREMGLPSLNETLSLIEHCGLVKTVIPNGHLLEWLMRMAVKHYLFALSQPMMGPDDFDRWCNKAYVPRGCHGLVYRHAIVACKQGNQQTLKLIANELRADQVDGASNDDLPLPSSIVTTALTEYSALVREGLARKDRHIANIESVLAERDAALAGKDQRIAKLEAALKEEDERAASLDTALVETEEQLRELRMQYQLTVSSVGFRLLERARRAVNGVLPPETRRRALFLVWRRAFDIILTEGWGRFLRRMLMVWKWGPRILGRARSAAPESFSIDDQYQLWLRAHALSPAQIRRIREELTVLAYRPRISIITPVYNAGPVALREAIESVRAQLYDEWELCIADDGSTKPEVRALLQEYEGEERIKIAYLDDNRGISAASNTALELASGEFVGFLDHDDELKPDALYQVVKLLNEQPDLDFIYSDEDKRSLDGRLVQPFFKPDWSPDLLLSVNYVPHFAVYRKRLVDELGGLRSECDFSQDYDLALRVTERTERIGHIPLPLYSWRMVPGSAASNLNAKPRSVEAGKRALADAMKRRGIEARIHDGPFSNTYRVRYRIRGRPLVSIVIPTRDRVDLLARCVSSIEKKTKYPNYEIVIVDNDSKDEATLRYLKKSPHRRLACPGPFHFASMMNFAVREAAGEHVILLNNDTEVITPDWIESMLEHSQRPEVAAVGARLFYPGGKRVQHEGVIIGLGGGSAGNVDHAGYFQLGEMVRNFSAVTAACLMARRDVFEGLGGFDESLRVAFNDVDYCLRARQQGYLIVYTPYALLYHHESGSRGSLHPMEDEQFFRNRWGNPGEYRDPYYNPNLSRERPFSVRL